VADETAERPGMAARNAAESWIKEWLAGLPTTDARRKAAVESLARLIERQDEPAITDERRRLIAEIRELARRAELDNELAAANVLLVLVTALTAKAEEKFSYVCGVFGDGLTAGVQASRN
jgi:hypothetical protein